MSVYAIFVRERLRDPKVIEAYDAKAGPSLAGHPVKVLAAYGGQETLEGAPIQGAVILEFPTMQAAKAWYDGPAYRDARQLRFQGADYRVFFVQGV
ncbi:MAG TPA: DUF1330 domain-containing protein [Planctomycetota bacterium]|nr:DUF1330 domain-containing protein [Planctomycetota bacterium]